MSHGRRPRLAQSAHCAPDPPAPRKHTKAPHLWLLPLVLLLLLACPAHAERHLSYSYDLSGKLIEETDKLGQTTEHGYNTRGQSESYELDAAGNKTQITLSGYPDNASAGRINPQPNGLSTLSYDPRGQIKTLSTVGVSARGWQSGRMVLSAVVLGCGSCPHSPQCRDIKKSPP